MSKKDQIINFYQQNEVQKLLPKNEIQNYESHHIKGCSRVGVIASSGGGKTNWLMNFIAQTSGSFGHIYVVYQNSEPLYEFLEKKVGSEKITFYNHLAKLPPINDFNKSGSNLIIFDDQVNANTKGQEIVKEFMIRSRKAGCLCLYLSQSWFDIPKLIRLQFTYVILLKLSSMRDLNIIMRDFSIGVDKDTLFKMYKDATKQQFDFLKIDLTTNKDSEKFSKNWNDFYNVKSSLDGPDSDSESDDDKPVGKNGKK